jgi:hypothetical protein
MNKKTNNKATAASLKLLRKSSPSRVSTVQEIKNLQGSLALLIKREREKAAEALDLSKRCAAHAQHASRALTAFTRLVKKGALCAVVMACASQGAHADDRRQRREQHNYIIERQQAYQVQGVPTSRLIIGRREIDIYRNGVMFERNNVVGVRK